MNIKRCGVVAVLALAGAMGFSHEHAAAQQPTPEQTAAIRQSCRSDFMANCSGVQPGGREAFDCLMRNASRVSAACKSALDAIGGRPTTAPPAPPAAAEPPPASAAAPPPAPPPPAATASPPGRQQLLAVRAACATDFRIHCPGVKPGGRAAIQCLKVNAPALSAPCRTALASLAESAAPPAAPPPPAVAVAPVVAPLGPIPPMRPRRAMEILSFCEPERATLCGGIPPGGGRVLECLAANAQRLSPVCYQAIARGIR